MLDFELISDVRIGQIILEPIYQETGRSRISQNGIPKYKPERRPVESPVAIYDSTLLVFLNF